MMLLHAHAVASIHSGSYVFEDVCKEISSVRMDLQDETSLSEADLLQAWRLKLLYRRRKSEASVQHHSVSILDDDPVRIPVHRKLSAPEDGLWAGLEPQAPAYQHHKGGLVLPNRHSVCSTARRSCTPSELDPWVMVLKHQQQQQNKTPPRRYSTRADLENQCSITADRKRKYVVGVFATFAIMLVALAVLMITVTLRISPEIDKIGCD